MQSLNHQPLVHEDPAIPSKEAKGMCPCCWFQTTRPASVVGRQPTNTAAVRSRTWTSQTALHVRREPVLALKPFDMGPRPGSQRSKGNTSTDKTKKLHPTQPTDNTISKLWTGRPYDLPPWFLLNRRDLYDTVNGARQFVRFGITVDKKVSVRSLQHAQAYLNGTIIEGTLEPRRAILDRIAAAGRRSRAD